MLILKNSMLYRHLLAHTIPFDGYHPEEMMDCLLEFLFNCAKKSYKGCRTIDRTKLSEKIQIFIYQLTTQWRKSNCLPKDFEITNKKWLNSHFFIPYRAPRRIFESDDEDNLPSLSFLESSEAPVTVTRHVDEPVCRRRPRLSLLADDDSSEQPLDTKYFDTTSDELLRAAHQSLLREGKKEQADLIKQASTSEGVDNILALMKKGEAAAEVRNYSIEAAAALLIKLGLSKRLYQHLRMDSEANCGIFIYPPYDDVEKAKKKYLPALEVGLPKLEELACLPKFEDIKVECSFDEIKILEESD